MTILSTGANMPMLIGNLVSLLFSFCITVPISLIWPQQDFDWKSETTLAAISYAQDEVEEAEKVEYDKEVEEKEEDLITARRWAYGYAWTLTFILIFLWPLPMLGERYVYSMQFFGLWVAVGFIWTWVAALIVIFYPIIESCSGTMAIFKRMAGQKEEVFMISSVILLC